MDFFWRELTFWLLSKAQRNGMQAENFQGTWIFQPSCFDQFNPRCKFHKTLSNIEANKVEFAKSLQIIDDRQKTLRASRQRRGAVIFPAKLSQDFLDNPSVNAYVGQFKLHLFCINELCKIPFETAVQSGRNFLLTKICDQQPLFWFWEDFLLSHELKSVFLKNFSSYRRGTIPQNRCLLLPFDRY